MSLRRLFPAELELHLQSKEILRPRRWFCSSSPPPPPSPSKKVSKRAEAAKVKKVQAIEAYVRRYMLKHPGVFPKVKEVHHEVGGSWYIIKDIVTEMKTEMLPVSQNDKQIGSVDTHGATESTPDAIVNKEKMDSYKLDTQQIEVMLLTRKLDAVESRIAAKKGTSVLATANTSDIIDLVEAKAKRFEEGLDSSEAVLRQQLPDVYSHKEEETIGALNADMCSSEAKSTGDLPTGSTNINFSTLNDDALETAMDSLSPNHIALETTLNCQTLTQKSLTGKPKASEEVINLVEFFEETMEKEERVNCTEIKTPKSEMDSDFKEDKNHVDSLVDVSKRNQSGSRGLDLVCEKIIEPARDSYPKEACEKDSDGISRMKQLLTKIIGLSKETSKTKPSVLSSETNKHGKMMVSSDIPCSYVASDDDADVAAFDYLKSESIPEVPHLVHGLNSNSSAHVGAGSNRNCLLVKFLLKTAKANDIGLSFGDCGPISEIHIVPSRRENRFNYAYVGFKTEDGLRKALSKGDITVCGADVVVEPASTSMVNNIMVKVEPVNDTDFPSIFLKNPNRTVMIKGLPDNLPFHHLRRSISVWGHVSGFAMGSSCSSFYVEFESEESKEKVLAEATISVSGRKLSIFRVDAPKTTVVRISNVNPVSGVAKIYSICDSYGRVKRLVTRDINTFDVHFKLSEWTNMMKILNRLNGLVVDQNQWVVQPATIIPAEVLQALWNNPGGQKHVYELFRGLCRRIEEKSISTAPLLDLSGEYYGDI